MEDVDDVQSMKPRFLTFEASRYSVGVTAVMLQWAFHLVGESI